MSLLNPSFIFVARSNELMIKKESWESLSHIFTKKEEVKNLLKIGDDLLESLLELRVELLGEHLFVVALL